MTRSATKRKSTDSKSKAGDDKRRVIIRGARLSYPHLYRPQERDNDDGTTRENYNCRLLIDKEMDGMDSLLTKLKRAGKEARKKTWGEDESKWPRIPSHQQFLKDGDNEDHSTSEENEGHYFINASSPVSRPPQVLMNRKDRDGNWIEAEEGKPGSPYAGCYVTAVIQVWAQKKDAKKNIPNRINASVEIVMFREDGEPFAAQRPDANDILGDEEIGEEGDYDLDDDEDDDDEDDSGLI